uniref:3-beta hydroxysteroid dehydrogenase/isomerase domain-containing protein n=1 Tax=Oryza nivara TaxID=4536 RepID=A0A0E0GVK7_ORYNI
MAAFNSTTICNTCSCVHGSTGSLVKQPDIGSPKGRTRQPPRVDDDDDDGRPGVHKLRVAAAIAGCDDVFHVACPVHTLAAAVTGTTNVRKACSEARLGLGRVVVVSYVSAAMMKIATRADRCGGAAGVFVGGGAEVVQLWPPLLPLPSCARRPTLPAQWLAPSALLPTGALLPLRVLAGQRGSSRKDEEWLGGRRERTTAR